MEVRLVSVYLGKVKRVLALALGDECPAQDFLNDVNTSDPATFQTLMSRIVVVADTPNFRNDNIFKYERDYILAWRTNSGSRLYAFHETGHIIIAVNGGGKGTKKQQTRDIDRAINLRNAYLAASAKGTIQIVDAL